MRPESVIQRAIRDRLAAHGFATVAVPNGAVLSGDKRKRAMQMNALKLDGLRVGFADLLVYGDQGRVGHIEVKAPKGKQSEHQLDCQAWLESLGHRYAVCRSQDEAVAALQSWGWM